jgi:drug/metabolite transporter (DMT)-like permease
MISINKNRLWWFLCAVVAVLLSVPNGIFVKIGTDSLDPIVFNTNRFLVLSVFVLPYIWYKRKTINRKNLKYAIYTGISTIFITGSYVKAISLGSVSFLSLFNLITPVMFILYSILIMRERLKKRALVGLLISALGAFILIGLPLIDGRSIDSNTPMIASIYALIEAILFPLLIILPKKANDNGMPVMMAFAIAGVISAMFYFCVVLFTGHVGDLSISLQSQNIWISCVYSAIVVGFFARWLNVVTYERLGAVVIAVLSYAQYVLAVLLPIIILGEEFSLASAISGVLILSGIVIAERHHSQIHTKHIKTGHH